MEKKILTYESKLSGYQDVVMIDKIKRLEICKETSGETFVEIHLIDGEVLLSSDSLKTLSARLILEE